MDRRLNTAPPVATHAQRHPALTNIGLVVFDLDGTLIDSVPDLARAVDLTLAERALAAAGEAKVRDWVGNGSHKLIERALADAYGLSESDIEAADADAAHVRFLEHYGAAPCAHTRRYDGVLDCLDALAADYLPCALITNKPVAFLPPILARLELEGRFSLVLGGDSLREKKPHPLPLLYAAEQLGVAPARALMIGDSRHDVAAGKAAGFRTLAVTYGYNHGEPIRDSGPDYVVDSLRVLGRTTPAKESKQI